MKEVEEVKTRRVPVRVFDKNETRTDRVSRIGGRQGRNKWWEEQAGGPSTSRGVTMCPSRFAAQALVEVKVADLGTVFALPTTTLGTSAALDQQVLKRHLWAPLADLVEAQRELVKTAVLRLRGLRRAPFVSG